MVVKTLYHLHENDGPLILNFPHSGTYIPDDIAAKLNELGRSIPDTDWHVPKLYQFAKGSVTWLQATHNRYVIDLNRDPEGSDLYPGQAGTKLCPTRDFSGKLIYRSGKKPELQQRLDRYFWPYHQQLAAQINRITAIHGYCILLDCHSIRSKVPRLFDGKLPDLNLGTFAGRSCNKTVAHMAEQALRDQGFCFVRDGRFKGGWITRHYGRPQAGVQVLQLEISQNAYMDEQQVSCFDPIRATDLQVLLEGLINNFNQRHKILKETIR